MLTSINGKIGQKPLLLAGPYRDKLISDCMEFRKTARTILPWGFTCEEMADRTIAKQADKVVQAGTKPNRTFIALAGFVIVGIILLRIVK